MLGRDGWHTGGEVEFFLTQNTWFLKANWRRSPLDHWMVDIFSEINAFLFGQNQGAGLKDKPSPQRFATALLGPLSEHTHL